MSERIYRVCVDVPERVIRTHDSTELFTAIADAAHEWEPEERDGWDIDVHAGFADEVGQQLTWEDTTP